MITFTLLMLALSIVLLVVAFNAGLIFIVFGDFIVCILLIILLLTRKRKRKNGTNDGSNSNRNRDLDD